MGFSALRGFFGLAIVAIGSQGWILGYLTRDCALPLDIAHGLSGAFGYELLALLVIAAFTAGLALLVPTGIIVAIAGIVPFELSRRNVMLLTTAACAASVIGNGVALGWVPVGQEANCRLDM